MIANYQRPKGRPHEAGGAPEIAAARGEEVVIAPRIRRTFASELDFRTPLGRGCRDRLRSRGAGPTAAITGRRVLEPDAETGELVLVAVHRGVDVEQVRAETAWGLKVSDQIDRLDQPTREEFAALRDLVSR